MLLGTWILGNPFTTIRNHALTISAAQRCSSAAAAGDADLVLLHGIEDCWTEAPRDHSG